MSFYLPKNIAGYRDRFRAGLASKMLFSLPVRSTTQSKNNLFLSAPDQESINMTDWLNFNIASGEIDALQLFMSKFTHGSYEASIDAFHDGVPFMGIYFDTTIGKLMASN